MRTDSVHLADEALEEIREYIRNRFDSNHLPIKARVYKTKAKECPGSA